MLELLWLKYALCIIISLCGFGFIGSNVGVIVVVGAVAVGFYDDEEAPGIRNGEGLAEEEELIEAVEAFVETAAVSVWSEIKHDVWSAALTLFPVLQDYLQDHTLLLSDLKQCLLTLILFVFSFAVLSFPITKNKRLLRTKERIGAIVRGATTALGGATISTGSNSQINGGFVAVASKDPLSSAAASRRVGKRLCHNSQRRSNSWSGFQHEQQPPSPRGVLDGEDDYEYGDGGAEMTDVGESSSGQQDGIRQSPLHTHNHDRQNQHQHYYSDYGGNEDDSYNYGGNRYSHGNCAYTYYYEDELTDDEAQFERAWPAISNSRYRRLVLPPSCKRVENPPPPVPPHKKKDPSSKQNASTNETSTSPSKKRQSSKSDCPADNVALSADEGTTTTVNTTVAEEGGDPSQTNQKATAKNPKHQDDEDEEDYDEDLSVRRISGSAPDDVDDNPAQRLQLYFHQFLHFVRSVFTFDYAGACWTLIFWMQGIRRYRRSNSEHHSDSDSVTAEPQQQQQELEQQVQETDEGTEQEPPEGEHGEIDSDRDHGLVAVSASPFPNGPMEPVFENQNSMTGVEKPMLSPLPSTLTTEVDGMEMQLKSRLVKRLSTLEEERDWSQRSKSQPASAISDKTERARPVITISTDSLIGTAIIPSDAVAEAYFETSSCGEVDGAGPDRESELTRQQRSGSVSDPVCSVRGETPRLTDQDGIIGKSVSLPTCDSAPENSTLVGAREDRPLSARYFFETANSQHSLRKMVTEVAVPDKNGYIVGDEFLPDSRYTPLLVFVNSRAGPQQGHLLITQLRRLLNPIQVWDLANGGPGPILESFCVLTRLRILVCGGDGTVSWIISALEKLKLVRKWPAIAILPLGTGNDLARIHGWGGGYNNESLIMILEQISESYQSLLDRWTLTIEHSGKKNKRKKEIKSFFNYLGVGADAQAALQVHYLRESRPEWFFSRLVNKAWYGVFGAEDIIKASSVSVRRDITLIADGVEIPLPSDSQGIILLNIDSYAGGVPLWSHGFKADQASPFSDTRPRRSKSMNNFQGTRVDRAPSLDRVDSLDDLQTLLTEEQRFNRVTACNLPSSCQDGLLDVVSIRGAFHLGQIKVGLSNAQRLCQCREATIIIKNKVAVQIDGEPWRQGSCTLRVKRKEESAIMLHRSADDGGVETEMSKLLDWAEERRLIDSQVHSILMKEFSRRIESKTRQRRVRSQDNILHNLKRAIGSTGAISTLPGSQHWQGGIAF